jgi:hypothetical protein
VNVGSLSRQITHLVVAVFFAAVAAVVYRSFVFSEFLPIRVNVVDAEQRSAKGIVAIPLPDFSRFRGHRPVLDIRLRNDGSGERQIRLLLDGFEIDRIPLPTGRVIPWNLVLSPGNVQALINDAGAAHRSLHLIGDGDGWAVTAFEIRNYRARLGDRPKAVVLPGRAEMYRSAEGFVPVVIAVLLLALSSVLVPKLPRKPYQPVGNVLTVIALFVCVTCLIVPRISPYKLLLSRSAFALMAVGLFSPVALFAARPLILWTRRIVGALPAALGAAEGAISRAVHLVSLYWMRHPITCERGAACFALGAIAIAQPVFEVVANSPEFFAARSTTSMTAAGAALAICLGIPLVLLGIERTIRAVGPRAASGFHAVVLALLSAAIVMPWFRRRELLTWPWDTFTSILVGIAVAVAYNRRRIVRQFFTALAPAALVVPALFFLDPAVAHTFIPSDSWTGAQTIERTPPIVLVIFDELPLNSLLDAGGEIDAGRYPNFAALARDAYWFRNAGTVSSDTVWAVPAILSGRYPTTRDAVPTLGYYPVNLFTALARRYDIFPFLRFQKLCPPRACQSNSAIPADTVGSLFSDFGLVWLHIVLPQPLTERLPPVVGDWADFGRSRPADGAEARKGRGGVFAEFLSSIDGRPARLHVLHLMLPHMAFEYVPSGRQYRAPDYQTRMENGKRLFERASAAYADALHQRHLAQVGYVDRLLGDLMARLREVGSYDNTLLIVTADHGASYREGQARREPQEHNLSDIVQVPLFMKLPGRQPGEAVDRIVETVDIFPTILDVLAAKVSYRLDGRSLINSRIPERSARTFVFRDRSTVVPRSVKDAPAERAASLARKVQRFGSGDLTGLYAPPGVRHVLGMKPDSTVLPRAPDVQITIHDRARFAAVELSRDPLPLYIRGLLNTQRSEPLDIAVVVNGQVAAVARSYRERGAHVFGTLIPETSLRDGNNTVDAFVVDGAARHAAR